MDFSKSSLKYKSLWKTFHLKLQAYQGIQAVKYSKNHQYTGSILHHEAYNEHYRKTAPMSGVWKCFLAVFRGLVTQGHYIGLENRTIKNMCHYKYEEVKFFPIYWLMALFEKEKTTTTKNKKTCTKKNQTFCGHKIS